MRGKPWDWVSLLKANAVAHDLAFAREECGGVPGRSMFAELRVTFSRIWQTACYPKLLLKIKLQKHVINSIILKTKVIYNQNSSLPNYSHILLLSVLFKVFLSIVSLRKRNCLMMCYILPSFWLNDLTFIVGKRPQ